MEVFLDNTFCLQKCESIEVLFAYGFGCLKLEDILTCVQILVT